MNIILTPVNKFAWIITGVFQSDGSFGIKIIKNKSNLGLQINLYFTLHLSITSLPLILKIKTYFNCGHVIIDKKNQMCKFEITDINSLWHLVIPHFIKYPFFGDKHSSFIKFVKILTLLFPYRNRNKSAFLIGQLIYLGFFLNPGSKRTKQEFNDLFKLLNLKILEIVKSLVYLNNMNIDKYFKISSPIINVYFILGVIEGDGSFYVGLRANRKIRFGFNITTHIYELDLLYQIKWTMNCGNTKIKSPTWCRYEVEGNKMLRNIFIPLVESQGGLLGSKALNFETFKEAMYIFTNKEHLTNKGLKRLVEITYNNTTKKGKGRKYTLQEYINMNNL